MSRRFSKLDAAAFGGYLLVAFLFLGVAPLVRGGHQFLGTGYDPQIFIWSFGWWPHAVLHGENPFITHAVWSPDGVNLAWSTSVPGLALLFYPVTLAAGPIVSYDVAVILMPALAAWAGFRLCRYVTGAVWPSLLGGYLFGFSSYVLAEAGRAGHLNLAAVFLLPLVALVILRFLDGGIDGRALVVRLGPLLALQILCSTEIAFTLALAVATALVLAFLAVPDRRRRLVALLAPLVVAGALAALVTAPLLYYALTDIPNGSFYPSNWFDADLVNFVVPTRITALGGSLLTGVSTRFPNLPGEQGAYLGLPALLIVGLFARERWRTPAGRLVLAALGVSVLAALGGRAVMAGRATVEAPWSLVQSLPLFQHVLTGRLVIYTTLAASLAIAMWTAGRRPGLSRWALPGLAVIAIAPNPFGGHFSADYHVPPFFTDSAYRACLDPGETVLAFPVRGGDSLLWQVDDRFRFNLAGGELGPDIPLSFFAPDISAIAGGGPLDADQAGIVRAFVVEKRVTSIVVDAGSARLWAAALDQVATPHRVGGVYLYQLKPYPAPCPFGSSAG